MSLSLDINLSVGRAATGSGAPSPGLDLILLTEVNAYMQTEDGFFIQFEP